MGFIEDRVGPKGYNALAKRILGSGRWPDEIQPRALGNALRELDQGRRRRWITEDEGVRLQVLADALTLSHAELRDLLVDHAATPAGNLVPLVDLPEARPIDLAREPLFPGIPDEVLSPAQWSRPVWWEAKGGAGRTLVGRWLEARGLARFVRARDARVALEHIGPGLPLYVELDRPDQLDQLRRQRLPTDAKICVAAPFEPPGVPTQSEKMEQRKRRPTMVAYPFHEDAAEADVEESDGWSRVFVPPLRAWADPLLVWVERRLDSSTGFDAREALIVVEQLQDWLRTPGDVLTLCGLIDQWGATTVRSRDVKALRHAAELAFQRLPESSPFRKLLTDGGAGPRLLLGLVRHAYGLNAPAVTMSDLTEHGLPRSTWEQLVPAELAPAPDLDGARQLAEAAEREHQSIEPASLLACLHPGPEELIAGLVEAHLLESQGEGRLVFRMRWLLRWAEERLLARFEEWSVDELGDALLHVDVWQEVVNRLLSQVRDENWSPIQRVVAAWQADDPARVIAMEAAFLAAGLGLLTGVAPPVDLCKQLWDLQRRTLVARFSDCHRFPALLPIADSGWNTSFDKESWALASIALTEHVPSARLSGMDQGLAPWLDDAAHGPLRNILRPIWEFWADRDATRRTGREVHPWAVGAFAMGTRLLERHGPLNRHDDGSGAPCLLFLPTLLARRLRGEPVPNVEAWDLSPIPFEVILSEAEGHGLTETQTLEGLWRLASGSNSIMHHLDNILEARGQTAERLWRNCPAELLARRVTPGWRSTALPFEILTDEQWMAVIEPLRQLGLHGDDAARVWRHLPWHVFEELARGKGSWQAMHEPARVMWSREHDRVRALTREVLPSNPDVTWLLWTMPYDTFLEELELWLHQEPAATLYVSSRLHAHACQRGPRWRESWEWLRRLQHGEDGQRKIDAAH